MVDIPTVANLTLQKLGEEGRLTSLDDDRSSARAMRVAWDSVRRQVLRKGKYNFSIFRRELAAQALTSAGWSSPYPFGFRFPLPAGFVRFIEILGPSSSIDNYKLERGAILSNSFGPLWVRIVEDVPDTTQWDDLFVDAFSWRLAFQVAEPVTGSDAKQAACWQGYKAAIALAGGVDAKEDPPEPFADTSWITARGDYGYGPGGGCW